MHIWGQCSHTWKGWYKSLSGSQKWWHPQWRLFRNQVFGVGGGSTWDVRLEIFWPMCGELDASPCEGWPFCYHIKDRVSTFALDISSCKRDCYCMLMQAMAKKILLYWAQWRAGLYIYLDRSWGVILRWSSSHIHHPSGFAASSTSILFAVDIRFPYILGSSFPQPLHHEELEMRSTLD